MPDSVKCLIEDNEVVEQISLMLQVLFYDGSTIAQPRSKTGLFFCQQFLSLGVESIEDNSVQDFAGTAN